MPQAACHWDGDISVADDPLGIPGSTSLYLCLPALRGCVVTDSYFHITCGTEMEKTKFKNLPNSGRMFFIHFYS
jgi:hypothetical protein